MKEEERNGNIIILSEEKVRYFLSLGSNLGNKKRNLSRGLSLLTRKGIRILKTSSLYKTQPVDYISQPWFLNQVVEVETEHPPMKLLEVVEEIEQKMGRERSFPNGPRIIDIDILLAEKMILVTEKLQIPHPRIEKRNFVLLPLKEIAPEAVHPVLDEKIENLWRKSCDSSLVKKLS